MSKAKYQSTTMRGCAVAMASMFIFNGFLAADAIAAPEEIQVYLDDFADVGKPGLDLHTNYVPSGPQSTNHQFRLTPEFSYGINTNWEVAAYFLTVKNPGGTVQTDGAKVRTRWRPKAPSADSPFYWAVNLEFGHLSKRFNPDETSGEIKLIGVWKTDPWTVGMNFNFDRSLRNSPSQGATSEIDTKVSYKIREGLEIGAENYSFLGANHYDLGQPSSHSNYLASDFSLGKWDLNVGLGRTTGQAPETVLKAVIGVPLN